MQIDPKKQTKKDNYKLLIGGVLPRPIAFVTSQNSNGVVNAAPFSFFNVVGTDPPLVSISCARKENGQMKDTARNISNNKEFVVHLVDGSNVDKVNDTSIEFPSDISEAKMVGLDLIPSTMIKVPRIQQSRFQMECKLHMMLDLGGTKNNPNVDFIIGEVVQFHIEDRLYKSGRVDTEGLDPVGRLAGTSYCKVGEIFSLPRLSYEDWLKRENK